MASHTLTLNSAPAIGYPEGTSVSLYSVANWPTPDKQRDPSAATPVGSSTATASVSSGNIAFGSVTDGDYWAYASVGGNRIYRLVHVGGPDPSGDIAHLSADQAFTGVDTFANSPSLEKTASKGAASGYMGLDSGSRGSQSPKLHASDHSLGGADAIADLGIGARQLADLARTGGWLPTGAITQNVDRKGKINSTQALTSGTLHMVGGIAIPGGRAVNSITFVAGSTALSVGTHQWFALFDQSRNKLAVTADDTSTAWVAGAAKTLALSATYTPTNAIEVYVGILVTATTPPNLVSADTLTSYLYTLPPILSGTSTTGLTTPATCPATAAALGVSTAMPYCYVS